MALLPPSPVGSPPGSSYWNDWYEKMRTIVNGITGSYVVSFNSRTGAVTLTSGDVTGALGYTPGTVTSVAATVPSVFSISGSPITTSGTLAITYSGLALPVLNGGTGTTTSTGTGSVVLNTSPTLVTPALGTPSSGVATNLTGLPLTSGVTGTLPIANGGTGTTTATGTAGSVVLSVSPTLTGTPLAPTAAAGTSTTQIATTEFVNNTITGPAFSAYQSTTQSVPNATLTKIQLQSEEFDTGLAFDSTTNYRFQPTTAGYYQISGCFASSVATSLIVSVFKNGAEFKRGQQLLGSHNQVEMSCLIFLNGSTDYVELFGFQASGAPANSSTGAHITYFQGFLARAA